MLALQILFKIMAMIATVDRMNTYDTISRATAHSPILASTLLSDQGVFACDRSQDQVC